MDRYKNIRRASILGIIGNIFLLVIKSAIGFSTRSQSMIADASNSAGDVFSSIVTYVGNKVSSRPRDEDHNLGHGKAEYIYSLFISLGMIALSLLIIKNSFFTFLNPTNNSFSIWLIIICIITILVKAGLYFYTNSLAKRYDNLLIRANSLDHRNDCFLTCCNLISCLLSSLDVYYIDGTTGAFIALWLIRDACKIFWESYNVLMDKSIDLKTKTCVLEIINSSDNIIKVENFNSIPIGYKYYVTFTIFVDGNMTTFESHKIADALEKKITRDYPSIFLVTIHIDPM